MTDVLLIYPYSQPRGSRSVFRFPPLGVGYVAAGLLQAGFGVSILDGTFIGERSLLERVERARADVVGVYSMVTLQKQTLSVARTLKGRAGLLVIGGPLPSSDPSSFLQDFDIVVRGEGERTMADVVHTFSRKGSAAELYSIAGISYRDGAPGRGMHNRARELTPTLDGLSFPARDLLPNDAYQNHSRRRYGYTITSIITSRGCPYWCEFCSNAVFGRSFRKRSAKNVVDEVEDVLALGYERVHFADDVFTLDRQRLLQICAEIERRGLRFRWECLARVDSMDRATAAAMRSAGCYRVYFGIESGVDAILDLMGKRITRKQAEEAVGVARAAGLETGGFFILCYPGETDDTVLETMRFASRLPLNYVSFTMPYPLPGTRLHVRIGERMTKDWAQPRARLSDHVCTYDGDFSESKMRMAIVKGRAQSLLRRRFGWLGDAGAAIFEKATDLAFRVMR